MNSASNGASPDEGRTHRREAYCGNDGEVAARSRVSPAPQRREVGWGCGGYQGRGFEGGKGRSKWLGGPQGLVRR